MADIIQKIALTGADEIKKQLADVGKAGEAAFSLLKTSVEGMQPSLSQFSGLFTSLQGALGKFGGAFSEVLKAGTNVLDFFTKASESADKLERTAESLGLSVEAYQKLSAAAGEAGITTEKFGQGFAHLTGKIQSEALQQGDAITKLAQLLVGMEARGGTDIIGVSKTSNTKFIGGIQAL